MPPICWQFIGMFWIFWWPYQYAVNVYVSLNTIDCKYQYYLSRSMGNLSNSSSDHSRHAGDQVRMPWILEYYYTQTGKVPHTQGLVKGVELCLNPYFFGWLEKWVLSPHWRILMRRFQAVFRGHVNLLYSYLSWETGMVWWNSSD